MPYKLLQQESTYLKLLKEMKMMTHVGSGPVEKAPKEKETSSPVEDGTGAGTKQAATGHPNAIPPIAYLKKELAKEGIFIVGENAADLLSEIKALPDEQEAIVRQKISEMKNNHDKCPECKCDPCECPGKDDQKKVSKSEEVSELSLKQRARMAAIAAANRGERLPVKRVAGSPSDIAAKTASFERRRAMWAKESVETVNEQIATSLPTQVQKQRRPVGTGRL